jgi:DNA-binding transcriptional ArsR family regulator
MVEQSYELDAIFRSLSDPTRRDILTRVSGRSMSVGEVARYYDFSFAGVAKHLGVLERAGLIRKTKRGREQMVALNPKALAAANSYLETYQRLWEDRLDSLDLFLQTIDTNGGGS